MNGYISGRMNYVLSFAGNSKNDLFAKRVGKCLFFESLFVCDVCVTSGKKGTVIRYYSDWKTAYRMHEPDA